MTINLLYHDVTPRGAEERSGFTGPEAARYKLTTDEFERHLNCIAQATKRFPRTEFAAGSDGTGDSWSITFDDGGVSASTEIAGRLEQRGWRGWFFIATDFLDQHGFCTREQVRDLHRRGHLIGSHSCSHPERISDCDWPQLLQEWSESCDILSEIVGARITSASVPGGFYSTAVARAAAAAGIRTLFNSEPTTARFCIDHCWVFGRFNVYRGMSATDAASLLTSPFRRLRQATFWNMKKIAKTVVGPTYKAVRKRLLTQRYHSQ